MTSQTTRTVLITGANAGIGKATAIGLAQAGYTVFATGRRPDALAELKAGYDRPNLIIVQLDVTDSQSIRAAAAEVDRMTAGRGIDVLVNNAGYGQFGPALELTDDAWRSQFEVNVFGLIAVTRAFADPMLDRGWGRIINLSSISGRYASPLNAAYNASKFAVEALSDSMRVELQPFGVYVVVIEPGFIKTAFRDTAATHEGSTAPETTRFAPAYDAYWDYLRSHERGAAGPEIVVRAIRRAIESNRPQARYMVPMPDRIQSFFLRNLPPRIKDPLYRRVFRLNRAQGTPAQPHRTVIKKQGRAD